MPVGASLYDQFYNRQLLNYWEDVTEGYLDFRDSVLFPWVDIAVTSSDVSRGTQCSEAFNATKLLPGAILEGFDAFVVLSWPGQINIPNPLQEQPGQLATKIINFDGGAGPTILSKPACAIPVKTANHTFLCHEVGHVLGWRHSYGVLNNGVDWDGKAPFDQGEVYGDPYDIMSSASFGSRQLDPTVTHYSSTPEFNGPVIAGWPNPHAFTMGPGPARAHVHFWDDKALKAHRVEHRAVPTSGQILQMTLTAAGRGGGVQLIALHPPGEDTEGRGRCYIEYRQKEGWDEGLDVSGNDLARQAVVVHTLADTAEGVRCWYRGRVVVPLENDGDVAVVGTALNVRVESSDLESGTVNIAITTGVDHSIDIHSRGRTEIVTVVNPQPMGTPCGDQLTFGTYITRVLYSYLPVSYGFGGVGLPDAVPLKVSWLIGGVRIVQLNGDLDVSTANGPFTVGYSVDPATGELQLTSRPHDSYRIDVTVTVTEADGGGSATAMAVFVAEGFYEGYAPGDLKKLDRCMTKYAKSAELRLRDYLIPPGPTPDGQHIADRVNQVRIQKVINQIALQHPAPASALTALAAMRYGVRIS